MSLYRQVADAIKEAGPIRLDKIAPLFPEKSYAQVQDAAKNAAQRDLIYCVRREALPGRGMVGVWAGGPKPDPQEIPRGEYGIPKVPSVWHLGAMA